jgi:flagellar biosynthesis protein
MKEEKRKAAVALKYDQQKDTAPKVVAKGKGHIAERLIDIAEQLNIPIHHDPDLVEVLSKLSLYEEIPKEVYAVVAKILSFVYKMNKEAEKYV